MSMTIGEVVLAVIAAAIFAIVVIIAMRRNKDVCCRDPPGKGSERRKMAIGKVVLAVIVVAILAIVAIAVTRRDKGVRPRASQRRLRKLPPSVCRVFCNAWMEAAQLASYAEGSLVISEKTREDFITLLSQFLGELESVKFELSREKAKELDHIRREVENIIETIKHIGITTLTYREIHYIHSRLKIIGDKLGCSCR
jgi:heme/copper-type cytochrome/quinol oxidase subunit 2